MLGVVFKGGRRIALERFPDPTPGSRQVVVEIKASGMCGMICTPIGKRRATATRSSAATSRRASLQRSAPVSQGA